MKETNVIKFIDRAIEMQDIDALEANSLGFTARVLVQASLPHRNPKESQLKNNAWIKKNGNFSLIIQQGLDREGDYIGFPFGNIPRLLLAYFSTQAVQLKSREVPLCDSLSEFMRALGMNSNGRDIRRMKEQLYRLLSANISFRYEQPDEYAAGANKPIAKKYSFWWDERNKDQKSLFKNAVILDEDFYDEISSHPVPIDMRAVALLKQSSLALDFYTWLTYRVYDLKAPQKITWSTLHKQVGSDYNRVRDFKKYAIDALTKVKTVYPDLNIEEERDYLLIKPSKPHIAPKKIQVLLPTG